MKTISEIIGWSGVLMILSAYILLSVGLLSSTNVYYQILNLLGAGGIVYHSLVKKDYEPMVLNIIWALVAVLAIIKILI